MPPDSDCHIILLPAGELTEAEEEAALELIAQALDGEGCHLVIDLERVRILRAAFIQQLFSHENKLRAKGRLIAFCHLCPPVTEALSRIFPKRRLLLADSIPQALQLIREQKGQS